MRVLKNCAVFSGGRAGNEIKLPLFASCSALLHAGGYVTFYLNACIFFMKE
jgi:hypothetical protein